MTDKQIDLAFGRAVTKVMKELSANGECIHSVSFWEVKEKSLTVKVILASGAELFATYALKERGSKK